MKRASMLTTLAMVAGLVGLVGSPASAAGPHWVNDDGAVGGNTSCADPGFITIGAAITAAVAGDTVHVCDGTYAENVVVNKSLTLLGEQAGVDARGRVAPEATVAPAAGAGIELRAGSAGSTIDGFSVTGGTSSITSSSGPLTGLSILNNRLLGFTSSGLFMNDSGTDITVNQNWIDGASKVGGGGLAHFDTDNFDGLHFTNNTVQGYGLGTGFFVDGNHNVGPSGLRSPLFDGNLIDAAGTGTNLGSRSFEFGTISNNTFSNNVFDGLQGGIQNSLIDGNVFDSNGRSGLAFTSFANLAADRGAQNTDVTNNEFMGNGFSMAGEALFFSSSQAAGTISTNEAHNNNIEGNNVGARYAGGEMVDVTCNWWADLSGPSGDGPGSGDSVLGAGLVYEPWLTAPAPGGPCDGPLPTQMERKEAVRDSLVAKQAAADQKDAKEIGKAIEHIDKSLAPELWVDDNHLNKDKGKKVFDEEKKAVEDLGKVKNTDVSAEILEIVDIDHDLAQTAHDEAPAGQNKDKAAQELAKGDAKAAEGKYKDAIDHYKKAWEHAVKA